MRRMPKPEELLTKTNLWGHPDTGHGGEGGTDPGCQRLSLVHHPGEASDRHCCKCFKIHVRGFIFLPCSLAAFFPSTLHPRLAASPSGHPTPQAPWVPASAPCPSLFQANPLSFPSSDSQLLPCLLLASFLSLSGLWATWSEDFQGCLLRQAPSPLSQPTKVSVPSTGTRDVRSRVPDVITPKFPFTSNDEFIFHGQEF